MKSIVPAPQPASARAFTLVELLIVITIITILTVGAYGGYAILLERGRITDARTTGIALLAGIRNFEHDYDRYPVPGSASKDSDVETDTGAGEGLVAILKGADIDQNPRQTDFLGEIKPARTVTRHGVTKYENGLIYDGDTSISLYDPWGQLYFVTLDLNYDNQVTNPGPGDSSGLNLRQPAIVYSAGKDGDKNTFGDNICTWKQ